MGGNGGGSCGASTFPGRQLSRDWAITSDVQDTKGQAGLSGQLKQLSGGRKTAGVERGNHDECWLKFWGAN